jgi:signal transduction histidine kinase
MATADYLAGRGIFGVVWLDDELRAVERYGDVAADIPLGMPIAESLVAFVGLEDDIRALKAQPRRSVALPGVKLQTATGPADRQPFRVNLAVYWMETTGRYLLLVNRAVSRTDLEQAFLAENRLRQMAEAEVAAQALIIAKANDELAIANRDLGEFAHVISHDLRAPLRGLRYAATDAQAAVAAGDGDAAAAHLGKVVERSRRMSAMLTGLLEYSRIGRKADAAAMLDTRALAGEIALSSSEGTGITVDVAGTWPRILTVAEPLDIVLRNLVDNAVKHHDRESGRITLACEDAGDLLQISVADDGPGIEPQWHSAIFEPFKQVTDEADGAGIGLALVKKTLERFGGSIAVQSDPAQSRGTTFRLTWPKRMATRTNTGADGAPGPRHAGDST